MPDCRRRFRSGDAGIFSVEVPTRLLAAAGPRVENRDLSELRKVQDVVSEDLFLLPLAELGAADLGADRRQHTMAVVEILSDLCGNLLRDRLVSTTDRLLRAVGQRADRNQAVEDQRQDGGRRDEQDEAAGDSLHRGPLRRRQVPAPHIEQTPPDRLDRPRRIAHPPPG